MNSLLCIGPLIFAADCAAIPLLPCCRQPLRAGIPDTDRYMPICASFSTSRLDVLNADTSLPCSPSLSHGAAVVLKGVVGFVGQERIESVYLNDYDISETELESGSSVNQADQRTNQKRSVDRASDNDPPISVNSYPLSDAAFY